jgi:hypothetical protein
LGWEWLIGITCGKSESITPDDDEDKHIWLLPSIKTFSAKSFYVATLNFGSDSYKFMLKTKSPSTIKTFLCLALKISISTQEVLLQRGGRCPESCLFCGQGENINHPFFTCPVGQ